MRSILGLAVLGVVAVIAAAGGWYLFIREDAELATNAPEVPSDLVNATATTDASGDPTVTADPTNPPSGDEAQTFVVLSDRSEAAYFVDEELASIGLPSTAKGSTTAITGTFYVGSDSISLDTSQTSVFTVDLTTLTSDEDRRDNRVQQALETGTFPTATFTVISVTGYDPAIPDGQEQTMQMTGTLDLHGVQKDVTWELKAIREANVITGLATVNFLFSDFNITPPNIAGFVSVQDDATLQMQIVAQQS